MENKGSDQKRGKMEMTLLTPNVRRTRVERGTGCLIVWDEFRVQRAGHAAHIVQVEVSESGYPQAERCDCAGYRYRGHCAHIDAVCAQAEFPISID